MAAGGVLTLGLFLLSHHRQLLAEPPNPPPPLASPAALAAPPQPGPGLTPRMPSNSPAPASVARAAALVAAPVGIPAFDNFAQWAERLTRSAANSVEGQRLAWKRREAMLELIQHDPARALALAAPFAWRQQLPPEVTRWFEQQLDGRGNFKVADATGFDGGDSPAFRTVELAGTNYQAFVYGRRLKQICQTGIPLHGIALDGKMAVDCAPLRALTTDEAAALAKQRGCALDTLCSVSGRSVAAINQPVYADSGGSLLAFSSTNYFELANRQWTLAESGGTAATGDNPVGGVGGFVSDAWTHGTKKVLYMRVNFPDDLTEPISEANAYAVMNSVNNFYTTGSYDLTALDPTVAPLVTVPQIKAYYSADPGLLLADARAATKLAGYDTANYDLDIVAFTTVPNYNFGGLAFVGGKGVWLQSMGAGVTAHELGHNYGLFHANFWNATTNYSAMGPGTNLEYGNPYDTMGAANAGIYQFDAPHKNELDWLKADAVQTVTSNGVYRIYPFDAPGYSRVAGRFYAAAVQKDALRYYWLEFRQLFTYNPWLENGLLLNWSPWSQSDGGTQLIDTTPGSPNAGGALSLDDAAVVIGRTFNDNAAGVHITPLQRGASGTDPWIECQINLGAFPSNQPPVTDLEVDQTNVPTGSLVHFHANASDPDGDTLAYAWSFDDLTFSTNNLSWTSKVFTNAGDHVVRCVVSDLKGGEASANAVVTVGKSGGFQVTGRVTDTNGVPLEGVLVGNGSTIAASFIGGWTDSDGRYVLVNLGTTNFNLNASQFGYLFTPTNWLNPLSVTNTMADVDFIGLPITTINITVDTNAVVESDTTVHQFTVTRVGDTNADLPVNIVLSGTAIFDLAYTLDTDLTATNVIVIPAGTNSVTINFKALNDGLTLGPQTVTVTLVDDIFNYTAPNYALTPLAQATITISDANSSATPTVTVTAATPEISEDGIDYGEFVFTRTGTDQNDLVVNYAVGGSAQAGTDFNPLAGVVVIPAGQSSTTVFLEPLNDYALTSNLTVVASLLAGGAYAIGSPAAATITLLNDNLTTVTVFPTAAPASPTNAGSFTIKRDGDLTDSLVVNYTVAGTAVAGVQYVPLSGTVTIPGGMASASVILQALTNAVPGQYVTLILTNNYNYQVGNPGSATICISDGTLPTVSISAPVSSVSEQGNAFGEFQISRATTSGNLTVNLALSGTAVPGWNYLPLDTPVVIPDGSSSVTLDVIPFQDAILDPTMTVELTVLASTNYNVASPATATVDILDDGTSQTPGVGFCFTTSQYPANESPGIAVSLTVTSAAPVTVDYRVIGGTAPASLYVLPQGTLTISNVQVAFVPLEITNYTTAQLPQTVKVVLFNPTNATLAAYRVHTYTILNVNAASVSVAATAASASENGPVPGNFRISRTGSTNASQLVNYQITGSASAPTDYEPLGTNASIPAGAAYVDLPVIPTGNPQLPLPQTVVLTLISATNSAIVSPSAARVTISATNSSPLPLVSVTSTNQPYAVAGGANGAFVFTRAGDTNNPLTVSFTVGGTAASTRYTPLPTSVTIPAGQTSVSLPVVSLDDHLVSGDQTVIVDLTAADTYTVVYPSFATVTVQDGDQMVWIDASIFDASKYGPIPGEFTFSRFGTTNTPVTVSYSVGGTASNGWDYALITNSIVIPAGALTITQPILPQHTGVPTGPLTATLTLLAATNYVLGTPTSGTVTIDDDMPMVTITAVTASVLEGGPTNGDFRLTRTGDPQYNFTAYLAVGGTAGYNVDYAGFLTNVYFSCGVTSIDLAFPTFNNALADGDHTVTASLIPDPSAYTVLAPSHAALTITDAGADATPIVQITKPSETLIYLLQTNRGILLEATVITTGTNEVSWFEQNGNTNAVFDSTNTANTGVLFTSAGVFRLQLTADDGVLQGSDEITVITGPGQLIPPPSLYWPFEEGGGTNVHDASGGGHDGVLVGNPIWVTNGVIGGALSFSGTNDYVRQDAGGDLLNGKNAFTLSLWVFTSATNMDQGFFTASAAGGSTVSLATRSHASCGNFTNVFEATIATTKGVMQRVSANNTVLTNHWQNLILTWSDGLAPQLYINGVLDQPNSQFSVLKGTLTNCPDFIVGRGPSDLPAFWNGLIDEVMFFPEALDTNQILSIGGASPAGSTNNAAPLVSVEPDATVQTGVPFTLYGSASDDGLPNPPGQLTTTWEQLFTNTVTIPDTNALTNIVVFANPENDVFRLIADDGDIAVFADVNVTVTPPTEVDVTADVADGYDMGPVPGDFTFTRSGGTNDLTVYFMISGSASNGVDYVTMTNMVTFTAESNSIAVPVMPILNYNIKGDQSVIVTLLTNIAYNVGNGQATVTIHDSPYGVWSIKYFSLEELTHPAVSGAGADFSGDGIVNFAKYAFNLNPRVVNTNPPYVWDFEINSNDNREHLTLTYTRWLPPRVVQYGVFVSTDLLTWYTGSNYVEEFSNLPAANGLTETVKTRAVMPYPNSTNLFMNIRVWLEQLTNAP